MADEVKNYEAPLPKQVRDQMAAAEALRTELATDPNAAPPIDGEIIPPAGSAAPVEGAPAPAAPAGTMPAAAASPAAPAGEESLEQKLRSAEGRLAASQRTNSALNERIAALEATVTRIQAAPAAPAPAPAPTKLLSQQEEDEYGQEMLEVVGKRAREVFSPELAALAARLDGLAPRVEGVGTVVQRTEQEKLYDGIAAAVPDWQQINVDDNFKAWLEQPDLYSGVRRHDLLLQAFNRHETNRVVGFFQGYKAEASGNPQTPQAKTDVPAPLNNGTGQKPSLADYAAPGRARSAPQELSPDKPIYTNAQISKFMADKLNGKWKGREADADAIEADIFQAQHEGRIVN